MIRGTTAKYKFKLPCKKSDLSWSTIKFWQPNNPSELLPIIKTLNHCGGDNELPELCVSLLPEETVRFSDKYKAKVQLRAEHNGVVFGSKDILITVYPMPDDIIENNPPMPEERDGWIILDGKPVNPQGGGVDG